MSASLLLIVVITYFIFLLFFAFYTSRNSNNDSFFIGNKNSNWLLVAFGMIGTSLSGVTFVSVPGDVGNSHWNYFQLVMGYFLGYLVVAYVLLPLYYKRNLTSIYTYLQQRFGNTAHKAGASIFIVARTIGATARLYLVINILQIFILDKLGIPFFATAFIILTLILLYTFEGGVKTIVYTDTLQTTGMLVGLVACIIAITKAMNTGIAEVFDTMRLDNYTQIFNADVKSSGYFFKQVLGGMFITITMTGLDQEMMQKNISVKTLGDSRKNMLTLSSILVFVNLMFLFLGGVLYVYANANGIMAKGDDIFPTIALSDAFAGSVGIIFIVALISALFPSVDGAITSLTSAFCIDILNFKTLQKTEAQKKKIRLRVHLSFALLFLALVMIFKWVNDKSIIQFIIKVAGITYGPLLALFAFGILTKRQLRSKLIWPVIIIGPLLTWLLDVVNNPAYYEQKFHTQLGLNNLSTALFHGYKIGPELILLNGIITGLGLLMISQKNKTLINE